VTSPKLKILKHIRFGRSKSPVKGQREKIQEKIRFTLIILEKIIFCTIFFGTNPEIIDKIGILGTISDCMRYCFEFLCPIF
jgi:hypothetical protein